MEIRKQRKIGFLLGTFDPIHKGHLHILSQVQSFFSLDLALLVPLYDAPHKDDLIVASPAERIHMCQLVCLQSTLQTTSIVIDNKIEGYSIELISILHSNYEKDRLFYILGSDVFLTILKWDSLDRIIDLVEFSVVLRDHEALKATMKTKKTLEEMGAVVHIFEFPIKSISSSYIKKHFKQHNLIKDMIPKSLEYYLKETSLYDSSK